MRGLNSLALSVFLGATLAAAAVAAPASAPAGTNPAPVQSGTVARPAPINVDFRRVGGEVSALIDASRTSPNIAAARANFQAGIMDCMEGDDVAANQHYQEAKRLLGGDQNSAPEPKS